MAINQVQLQPGLTIANCGGGDFTLGTSEADRFVDEVPFKGPFHLKSRIGGFASTSFGIIVRKKA